MVALFIVDENMITSALWKLVRKFFTKTKHEITMCYCNPNLGYFAKGLK